MDCLRVRDDVPTTEVTNSRNHIRWTNKQTRAATSSEWMKVDFRTRDVLVSQEIHPWTFHRVALSHVSVASKGSESILLGPQRPLVSGNGGRRLAAVSQQQRKNLHFTDYSVHADKLPASRCLFGWLLASCIFLSSSSVLLKSGFPTGCRTELARTDEGDFFFTLAISKRRSCNNSEE